MPPVLFWYVLLINGIAFAVTAADKWCAVHGKRRVPEKTLFLLAGSGGSFGVLLAMYLTRHKTQKPRFRFGVPAILLLQIGIAYAYTFLRISV